MLGSGQLTLSQPNTYTGGTTINGGVLQFTKTNAMPASGTVTVNNGATLAVNAGGTGEFTGATSGNGSIGGLLAGVGGQGASSVTWNAGAILGIDTTNAGAGLTYSGVIADSSAGTLGLTKLGAGQLTLSASNTYTGGTIVSAGTLVAANLSAGDGQPGRQRQRHAEPDGPRYRAKSVVSRRQSQRGGQGQH